MHFISRSCVFVCLVRPSLTIQYHLYRIYKPPSDLDILARVSIRGQIKRFSKWRGGLAPLSFLVHFLFFFIIITMSCCSSSSSSTGPSSPSLAIIAQWNQQAMQAWCAQRPDDAFAFWNASLQALRQVPSNNNNNNNVVLLAVTILTNLGRAYLAMGDCIKSSHLLRLAHAVAQKVDCGFVVTSNVLPAAAA